MLAPGESYYIYEKTLAFPGLNGLSTSEFQGFNTKEVTTLNEEIVWRIPVRVIQYLKSIQVHSMDGAQTKSTFMSVKSGPGGKDVGPEVGDINRGFGGKFVYLEPLWTDDPSRAANKVELRTFKDGPPQWARVRGQTDLAIGSGGLYRFLDVWHSKGHKTPITDMCIWDRELFDIPEGWTGMTVDLNVGRGGRHLYLVWKSIEV